MSGFSIGDKVRLVEAVPRYEWTEKLVGEDGRVVEVREAPAKLAVAVEGLLPGEPLWFSPKRLRLLEEGAA